MFTKQSIAAIAVAAVLATTAAAGGTAESACQMCGNIGMGAAKFACPKEVVSSCQLNIDGWCCKDKKEHPKCKACGGGSNQNARRNYDDDEDEDDDDDE